ncbi:putative Dol-P-Glc:Glc(2)Man(9)GlcNAc(2)-PP-Dol alpha-1,2-glucosyltransferase [Teleopsis dalmanni]|uniref:putative Dol-P-Glc:Glc(2)Man(9)GlcNAc(2)-PP-Dol alpha-1,2-glucosyltransferase n=1 Tax=Teleopsis dalmanni TaxID=139649 RepID=UPI0018CED083|nr:putative Dol-P-Glc:Glc(2)Man(9)GlcNAc(2)-PP-Dol alpha-1,2-glucosyltransferase [Teleopsis dalmanni]
MQNYVWLLLLPILYVAYSLPLFLRVYATTHSVIDEEFHLRQGLHFCNKRFDIWDPKITTFPGLYLISLVLNPINSCSVLGLRLISFTSAVINVVLLYKIRRRNLKRSKSSLAALDAFTIAALPPLYFFSHLYYTDTISLTTILLFYYFWQKESHLQAAVYAAASVLMRQTNVVWVGMAFGIMSLDVLIKNYAAFKRIKYHQVQTFKVQTWLEILTNFKLMLRSIWQILKKGCFYLVILLPFVAFVFINGSIVIGDKQAHEASIHLPQLFYFSIFVLIFAISNSIKQLKVTLQVILHEKLIVLFVIGVCVLIVKWNTLVHPYLLADNRHYTFYIWNRLYGRFSWFKYAVTPVYIFALIALHNGLRHERDSFKIMYWISVVLVLCFQRLLEVRYFLVPFVLFRLHTYPTGKKNISQWLELGFYLALNALTFYIFFTKEIIWQDFNEPQRIIW